jgi:hypothetical protein
MLGVTRFVSLRLSDARDLVLALDHRLLAPLEDPHLGVRQANLLDVRIDQCGTFTKNSMAFVSDSRVELQPGHTATLRIQGRDYETWNLSSTFVTDDARCTDLVHDIAWSLRRLPDGG